MKNHKHITSPLKAIRAKCVDCCAGQVAEVRKCPVTDCELYPFRFAKNPFRAKRVLSDEQKQAAVKRLAKARAKIKKENV